MNSLPTYLPIIFLIFDIIVIAAIVGFIIHRKKKKEKELEEKIRKIKNEE